MCFTCADVQEGYFPLENLKLFFQFPEPVNRHHIEPAIDWINRAQVPLLTLLWCDAVSKYVLVPAENVITHGINGFPLLGET